MNSYSGAAGNQNEERSSAAETPRKQQLRTTRDDSTIVTQRSLDEKRQRDGDSAADPSAGGEEETVKDSTKIWKSNQRSESSRESDQVDCESSSSVSLSRVSSTSTLGDSGGLPDTKSEDDHASESVSKSQPRSGAAPDMLAPWNGSVSVSANSDFSGSGNSGSVSDLLISESSASVEDLESSSADSFVSSLSSFGVQPGACKLLDSRLIESIPSIAMPMGVEYGYNADDYYATDDSSCPQCRTYNKDDFVQPDSAETAGLTQEVGKRSPRRSCKWEDRGATNRLFARLRPPQVLKHSTTHAVQPQFVSEDPELFVKFSGLQGILLKHVPRRRDFFMDLGCGTSTICKEMVLRGYSHVFGIDVAVSKIQRQQDECKDLEQFVHFLEMDASEMRFPDSFFGCMFTKAVLDMVAASYVYAPTIDDNFDELQRILREICRCLQPGGVWIMVSCHSATRSERVLKNGFDVEERVSTPWWEWSGISEFIASQFDRVKSYNVGTPILENGRHAKPFVVIVFRRKQTRYQRLKHLRQIQLEEMRDAKEFEVLYDWAVEKRRWHAEQEATVRESRAMIQEDVRSRYLVHSEAYATAAKAREAMRNEIYNDIVERDRAQMEIEDAVAAVARTEWSSLIAFVKSTLFGIGNDAVSAALADQMERNKLMELEKPAYSKTMEVTTDGDCMETAIAQTPCSVACNMSSTLEPTLTESDDQTELDDEARHRQNTGILALDALATSQDPAIANGSLPTEALDESPMSENTSPRVITRETSNAASLHPIEGSVLIGDVDNRLQSTIAAISTTEGTRTNATQEVRASGVSLGEGDKLGEYGNTADSSLVAVEPVGSGSIEHVETSLDNPKDTGIAGLTEADMEAYINDLLRSAAEQEEDMLAPGTANGNFDADPVIAESESAQVANESMTADTTLTTHHISPVNEPPSESAHVHVVKPTSGKVDEHYFDGSPIDDTQRTADAAVLIQSDPVSIVSITEEEQSEVPVPDLVSQHQTDSAVRITRDAEDIHADALTRSLLENPPAEIQSLATIKQPESSHDMNAEQLSNDNVITSVCEAVLDSIVCSLCRDHNTDIPAPLSHPP